MDEIHKSESLPKYKSSKEKSDFFDMKLIDSVEQLQKEIEALDKGKYYFRGVSNWSYKMYSSYHRYLFTQEYEYIKERSLAESEVLNSQFDKIVKDKVFIETSKRIADHYNDDNEGYRIDNAFDRHLFLSMSKLQHYDQLSFLLDFSYNPLVSLYFACTNNNGTERASLIYFPKEKINYVDLEKKDEHLMFYGDKEKFHKDLENAEYLKNTFHRIGRWYLTTPIVLAIDFENEFIFNERQQKQEGCFITYRPNGLGGPRVKPLEELLAIGFTNPANREQNTKPTSLEINPDIFKDVNKMIKEKGITKSNLGL